MTRDDGYTRYTVRIPTPLYERVKQAAGEASVNSLLVQVLEEKYPAPRSDAVKSFLALVDFAVSRNVPDESIDGMIELRKEILEMSNEHAEKMARQLLNIFADGLEKQIAENNGDLLGDKN